MVRLRLALKNAEFYNFIQSISNDKAQIPIESKSTKSQKRIFTEYFLILKHLDFI